MGRGSRGAKLVFLLGLVLSSLQTPASADKKSFMIFFWEFPDSSHTLAELLAPITHDFNILYYLRDIGGIALQIDEVFVTSLRELPGVVTVIQDSLIQVHTTHSWEFLGLASNGGQITSAWSSTNLGVHTIIGSIDTGVWPESQSFRNDTTASSPSRWRGSCNRGNDPTFYCNRKLIGARFFNRGILSSFAGRPTVLRADLFSPRDYAGHGTHVLSTAGGSFVRGAGVLGHGRGTAAGGSPRARVASYKACYQAGCSEIDVVAAIVAAVADGVHVISLSLGTSRPPVDDYLGDQIAIATLFAVRNGVAVVAAAGNSGPAPSTATNVAPWIFTVGASTTDRDFPSFVNFGDHTIEGQGLTGSTMPVGQAYPIATVSSFCTNGSLDTAEVEGKIVVCDVLRDDDVVEMGRVVKKAGGVGMVLCNDPSLVRAGDVVSAVAQLLPAAHCSANDCVGLFDYLESGDTPSGYINATAARIGGNPAPKMAAFSSRGPNAITPQILKPDITAPGVNVIAAYSGAASPTTRPFDHRRVAYNAMSGTSMSCAHVSGIAGLLKTKYTSWSPAMIKSAIMTTAYTMANDGNPIGDEAGGGGAAATAFHYGSGHVDPVKALDPGLVYDATPADYTNFLCGVLLTRDRRRQNVRLPLFMNRKREPCTTLSADEFLQLHGGRPEDLNYPSITVAPCLSASSSDSAGSSNGTNSNTVKRRLKNVGPAGKYRVTVTKPDGVEVTVEPDELDFGIGEEKEFKVKLDVVDAAAAAANGDYVFGSIVWSDVKEEHRYHVRSPVVVKTKCG